MKRIPPIFILVFLAITGCSTIKKAPETVAGWVPESVKESARRVTPDGTKNSLTSTPSIVWDQWVRRSKPQIYVQPKAAPLVAPTAIFMPFQSRVDLRNSQYVAKEVSRMLWQTWLQNEVLPIMEFAENANYYSPRHAVMLARQRGADLAIGGYLTHYIAGGTAGDTSIAFNLEVYDAASGQLVWSMAHAGLMQSEFTRDYIFFSAKTRLPSEPSWAIMHVLGAELGKPLQDWLKPLKAEQAKIEEEGGNAAF